jgi:hypothetical protein
MPPMVRERIRTVFFSSRHCNGNRFAHAHGQFALRRADLLHRQRAVHLAANVYEDCFRRNGDDGTLNRFAPVGVVFLLELLQDVAERILIRGRGLPLLGVNKVSGIVHGNCACIPLCHKMPL